MLDERLVVLFLDDDEMVRTVVEAILDDRGHMVRSASSAGAALEILASDTGSEIDLVLSDEMMPEMRGSELLGVIAERWPDLPAAIISGYSERLAERGLPRLSKPFTSDDVGRVVGAPARVAIADQATQQRTGGHPSAVRGTAFFSRSGPLQDTWLAKPGI
ncbi:response regulator [Brevundimonas sp.]|uniref:response regulator n=1 Tax=Brevundimonas sp. TaxID=1871086 RepID=UPI0025CBB303|nr:response regulator [Brevundimonas sp.]